MNLPVIETPRYSCKLPVTEQSVSYRPFLVGEQKNLLIAQESDEQVNLTSEAIRLIQACVNDEIIVDALPMADVEYLFLQVRIKSAGETTDIQMECSSCKELNELTVDLTAHTINTPEAPESILRLNDEISIELKHPSIKDLASLENQGESQIVFGIINKAIDKVINGDEVLTRSDFSEQDLDKFIEGMSVHTLDSINSFMDNQPSISISSDFTCKHCSHFNINVMTGLESFFA